MTTTKINLTALRNDRVLATGIDIGSKSERDSLVGRKVTLPTNMANETAEYTFEKVWKNDNDEVIAWAVRPGHTGHHVRIVAK